MKSSRLMPLKIPKMQREKQKLNSLNGKGEVLYGAQDFE
jgi:hypothetical protein